MKNYKYKINGVEYTVEINDIDETHADVTVNGDSYSVEIEKQEVKAVEQISVPKPKAVAPNKPAAPTQAAPANTGSGRPLKAPLPGVVTEVKVIVGASVKKGDVVLVLEAMKMQNNICAESDGVVTSVCVNNGDSVLEGATLLTIG